MGKQTRRDFFKTSALLGAGVAGLSATKTKAAPENILADDRMGVLVDTTVCIGCRKCEWACKKSHGYDAGQPEDYENVEKLDKNRRPECEAYTVVNRYQNDKKDSVNVKFQCMHCDHPACVSACIVGAFTKSETGAVTWDGSKCIGCRYCMVACPFQVPTFEYGKAIEPEIRKCDFCADRTAEGKLPACVDICPAETLVYGKRSELVRAAHKKMELYPDRYDSKLIGEHTVGGTSWLYLAPKGFTDIGFPKKLGENPAPGVSESIQHGIFAYFVPPIALYALLGGIMWVNKNRKKEEEE